MINKNITVEITENEDTEITEFFEKHYKQG